MGDLLVECPIHLDAVPINDVLVFKCGHGFCEPCLEEHFAHHVQGLSCPTCRKPVRRKEAFPLFLAPAQPSTATQSGSPSTTEATRLARELKGLKATHASCSNRLLELQDEIDAVRRESLLHTQTIQHLRNRHEQLQERLAKGADHTTRAREEIVRVKEEMAKLHVENQKTSRELEQTRKEAQVERERVKQFQGYTEQYKHKYNLEKKKRKAIENASHTLPRKEDESLMVVDANAPDIMRHDEPDFAWLDEACRVKGDNLTVPGDEDFDFEKESEGEVQVSDREMKGRRWEAHAPPPLRLSSEWNLGRERSSGPSSGTVRKRGHGYGNRQVGGSKIVKVKMPTAVGAHKEFGGPLAIDRHGHIKGTVALGSRQKLNSKN